MPNENQVLVFLALCHGGSSSAYGIARSFQDAGYSVSENDVLGRLYTLETTGLVLRGAGGLQSGIIYWSVTTEGRQRANVLVAIKAGRDF